jgi:outer membrane protein OmpA-like peptidoglycan-associated protein
MYYTGAGDEPDVLRGTTMFSLSTAAFGELKAKGATPHRYVSLYNGEIIGDLDGVLARDATDTIATIVNDHEVELPVVRASGTLRGTAMGKPLETRVTAAIVDEERFPLILEYALPDVGANGFSVRYTKISFPTERGVEEGLASAKRIDVYGIYFDFASDRIRSESDPVLREIADALSRNPDWRLSIGGHTDNVGGDAYNLDLSNRRAAAVKQALVTRYKIDGERLQTAGYGLSAPKGTNDTPEGRARNRRVELVRQ